MVTVQCSRPDEIKLNVGIELTIGEWKRIITVTEKAEYYGPLADVLQAIRIGIRDVQKREVVNVDLGEYK